MPARVDGDDPAAAQYEVRGLRERGGGEDGEEKGEKAHGRSPNREREPILLSPLPEGERVPERSEGGRGALLRNNPLPASRTSFAQPPSPASGRGERKNVLDKPLPRDPLQVAVIHLVALLLRQIQRIENPDRLADVHRA